MAYFLSFTLSLLALFCFSFLLYETSSIYNTVIIFILILFKLKFKCTWQLYPLFSLPFFQLIILLFTNENIFWIISSIELFFIFSSVILLLILPIGTLPKPRGKYAVGTINFHSLLRYNLSEEQLKTAKINLWHPPFLGDDVDDDGQHFDHFNLAFKLWYPIEQKYTKKNRKSDYLFWQSRIGNSNNDFPTGKIISRKYLFGLFTNTMMVDHIPFTQTNSYINSPLHPPVQGKGWPLILFSPGQYCTPEYYSVICEELASNGFIVCSLYQDDETRRYPGPSIIRDNCLIGAIGHLASWHSSSFHHQFSFTYNEKSFHSSFSSSSESEIESLVSSFRNRIDLSTIGLCGHSFGGSTVAAFCKEFPLISNIDLHFPQSEIQSVETKIISAVGLDAWVEPMYGDVIDKRIPITCLMLSSDLWNIFYPERLRGFCSSFENEKGWNLKIKSTSHFNFTDLPFTLTLPIFSRLRRSFILCPKWFLSEPTPFPYFGSSPVDKVLYLIMDMTIEFFISAHTGQKYSPDLSHPLLIIDQPYH